MADSNAISARFRSALQSEDFAALVALIPYAEYLQLQIEPRPAGRRYILPFSQALVGNPYLPAMHGGVLAGFLELAAQFEVLITQQQRKIPGPVDFAIDYLRSAQPRTCFASCELIRQGRRVVQAQATVWQTDPGKPVATARMVFLLQDRAEDPEQETQ